MGVTEVIAITNKNLARALINYQHATDTKTHDALSKKIEYNQAIIKYLEGAYLNDRVCKSNHTV